MLSILKNRNFSILFFGQLVSVSGNNLFTLALPWYVYTVTGSKVYLASTGIATYIPAILGIFSGVYIDRFSNKLVMIMSDLIRLIISLGMVFLVFFHFSIWWIIVGVFILEIAGTFFNPASSALLPKIAAGEEYSKATGLFQSSSSGVALASQVTGGLLYTTLGPAYMFLANAASFAISVLSLGFLKIPMDNARQSHGSFREDWMQGIKTILLSKLITWLIFIILTYNFALAPFDIIMTVWVRGTLHGGAKLLGFLFGSTLLGNVISGFLLHHVVKRFSAKMLLRVSFPLLGALIMSLGFSNSAIVASIDLFIVGVVMGLLSGGLSTILVQSIPVEFQGRIFSILNGMGRLMMPAGVAVFGWLLVVLQLKYVFIAIGTVAILCVTRMMFPLNDDLSALQSLRDQQTAFSVE